MGICSRSFPNAPKQIATTDEFSHLWQVYAMRETLLHTFNRTGSDRNDSCGVAGDCAWRLDVDDQSLALLPLGGGTSSEVRLPTPPIKPPAVSASSRGDGLVVYVGVVGGVVMVDARQGLNEPVVKFAGLGFVGDVACLAELDGGEGSAGCVAVGFRCGSVARVVFSGGAVAAPSVDVFGGGGGGPGGLLATAAEPDPVPINADNTSVVSAETQGEDASGDGRGAAESHVSSYRSAASTISRGLMGRLFGRSGETPPAGVDTAGGAGASVAATDAISHGLDAEDQEMRGAGSSTMRHHVSSDGDAVQALAVAQLSVPVVVSLHASGRVCVFAPSARQGFLLAGEVRLSVKLAPVPAAGQFLISPGDDAGTLLAVLTLDCDPHPHALRVFSLALSMGITRRVSVTATPLLGRAGPFDRLTGAAALPAKSSGAGVPSLPTLLLATESGRVSGFLLPSAMSSEPLTGLPANAVWSARDDLTSPLGAWAAFDALRSDISDKLLAAHRFSSVAVAKSLRVPNLAGASVDDVAGVAADMVAQAVAGGEDESKAVDRIVQRAQRAAVVSDLPISRLEYVLGTGVVVSRVNAVHVVRPLLPPEAQWFVKSQILSPEFAVSWGEASSASVEPVSEAVTRLLAVRMAPQVAAAELLSAENDHPEVARARCVLSVSMRLARTGDYDKSICELAVASPALQKLSPDAKQMSFATAVQAAYELLSPGRDLLCFLHGALEFEALEDAAARSAQLLPISSLFCFGLVFLENSRRTRATGMTEDEDDEGLNQDSTMEDVDGSDSNVHTSPSTNAFTSFVSAAKYARSVLVRGGFEACPDSEREDLRCAIDLAQLKGAGLVFVASSGKDAMVDDGNDVEAYDDPEVVELAQCLDFWLLERALRLVEGVGSPKAAAAIALEALAAAPGAKKYEMMRAAAFGKFLDAGDLQCALQTILKAPFQVSGAEVADAVNEESASALRDSIGLLVNAAIDAGKFTWLLRGDLPSPVKELAALALERRARSSEMFVREYLLREVRDATSIESNAARADRISSPYEYLYIWQLGRKDIQGAASCAVEWFERVATEGLGETRMFANSAGSSLTHSPLALLLTWARIKSRALAAACTAIRSLPPTRQFVARSRHSVMAGYTPVESTDGVIDLAWLSRRLLLARAQMICLAKRMSSTAPLSGAAASLPSTEYVVSQADILLGDQERGVNFAVSSLLSGHVSCENVFLALDLALSWDVHVAEVVRVAGILSSSDGKSSGSEAGLSYSDLSKILTIVTKASREGGRSSSRNWYLVAADGALEASAGTVGVPRWLSDAAAFGPGVGAEARTFASGDVGGDARGMVNAWLRYGRLVDAAQLLISGLRESIDLLQGGKSESSRRVDVPYTQIDATLKLLTQSIEDGGSEAVVHRHYCEELRRLAFAIGGTEAL